jgi:acyl-coenzyme A thioesterase PaaI-like protein
MGIHYIAPGRGDRLVARGTVLKPGKRLLVVQADVLAVDATGETLVARLTGTMIRVPATG